MFGFFSKKAFQKEMTKNKPRKSTVDNKSILMIPPDSEEAKIIDMLASRRSKTESLLTDSSGSDGEDNEPFSVSLNVGIDARKK